MTRGPETVKVETGVAAGADGGFHVTANSRPATTPRGNVLAVPTRALAEAIAGEIREDPRRLAGKGLEDPAAAPNFRIAAGALDVIAGEAAARAALERDLAAYGETDLVCFRADGPEALTAREAAHWDPLCAWFGTRFGVPLAVTRGVMATPQAPAVAAALAELLGTLTAFDLAALSLATRAAGSIVIGLALVESRIDAEAAFAAAVLEEAWQAERWGEDAAAARARAVKRLDLQQAARFVELLSEG